jgi:hypothetical protein
MIPSRIARIAGMDSVAFFMRIMDRDRGQTLEKEDRFTQFETA